MRRREFISLIGAAATLPVVARAQKPGMPVVGFLNSGVPKANATLVAAFRKGLSETGYVEHQTVEIEYRWAHNDERRLPDLAADLVRSEVAVLAAPGGLLTALAAKAATTTIPVVFSLAADPVQLGLVASLNQPGGNVTGINTMGIELRSKLIALLHDLMPRSVRFGMFLDPSSPSTPISRTEADETATALGRKIKFFNVSSGREIDAAFARLEEERISALIVPTNPLFNNRHVQIATLAARKAIATICGYREYAEAGALMSYGTNNGDMYRQAGIYIGRILKGEKPADLPIMRATKFEFVINLQTARTIGIEVPVTLLAQADEVIE
jgi:putative ABC transport system substrate-binding protein